MIESIHVDNVEVYTEGYGDGLFIKCQGRTRFVMLSELRELAMTDGPVEVR